MERDTLPSDEELAERPAMIVAAHPDDEVIGLSTRLSAFNRLRAIVHITDGAPRNGSDITNAGKSTWQEYADLRRAELNSALEEARCKAEQTPCFWCPDQRALNRIASHARRLASLFERLRPHHVFTHPYEGGHPDHDAVAASVHCAAALIRSSGLTPPLILEFASYHASPSGLECECFLDHVGVPIRDRELGAEQRTAKQRLFRCYRSQQDTLAWFPIKREPIRLAPAYDFSSPPHEGQLLYESFGWGFTGTKWCRVAAAGLRKFSDGLSS
jgi:LmbE family N-acetylglucosaminyl deacetylase